MVYVTVLWQFYVLIVKSVLRKKHENYEATLFFCANIIKLQHRKYTKEPIVIMSLQKTRKTIVGLCYDILCNL